MHIYKIACMCVSVEDQLKRSGDIEAKLNFHARVISTLAGKYARVVNQIKRIFEEKKFDIKDLILNLCSCDAMNLTIFSTDEVFAKVANITELFHEIGKYCNMYDYDLLLALVESTGCDEAIQALDGFAEQLKHSILRNLDLLSEDGALRDPKIMPGTHSLKIKYVGGKCTLENNEIIKRVVYECFHLERVSLTFRGAQEGCVALVYQISHAVKSYLEQYQLTGEDTAFLAKHSIAHVLIDDEELKLPLQKQKVYCKMYLNVTTLLVFACNYTLIFEDIVKSRYMVVCRAAQENGCCTHNVSILA